MKIREICNILLNILLITVTAVLVVDLAYGVYARVNNEKLPVLLGFSKAVVEGSSMEPALCKNDMVIAYRKKGGYEIGDVIIFDGDGRLIIHRIIEIAEDGRYVTQGDNAVTNPNPDTYIIYDEHVYGGLVLAISGAGKVMEFMQKWGIVFIPLCVGLYVYLSLIMRNKKKEKSKG
jgi:signal peptidase I